MDAVPSHGLTNESWIAETIEKLTRKMTWLSEKSKNKIPSVAAAGTHDDKSDTSIEQRIDNGINWWCNGFWGGMLWMMFNETGDARYAEIARISETKLDTCFEMFYGLHHDVGFMYMPTAVTDYRLTGDKDARRRGMHAANLLAGRFNPIGKYIRAWNDLGDPTCDTRGWAIIDCMMNLSLLYWASEESDDPRFRHIAMQHADTVIHHFIRADGSVRHIVEFDPETGEMVKDYGGQGYALGSAWTRGQAWGLYGFMISYLHTKEPRYLEAAQKIAHYFIANIPEDGIIPVDFRQPKEPFYCDDTAAAIAACGLIEMGKSVDVWAREMYFRPAKKMLRALCEQHCDFSEDNDGITLMGAGAYTPQLKEHNIIYGDFYFMEALLKLRNNAFNVW